MDLQQRFHVSVNEYEESEGNYENREKNDAVKTEDIYQILQLPPTAYHGTFNSTAPLSAEHCERKHVFLLFAVNVLISAIILVIVGLNYSHNRETQPIGQKEMWLLRDNVFYLFWSEHSDCSAAESFCSKRNASLVVLTEHNKVWLMSSTNGKQILVSRAPSDGSGGTASPLVDDEDRECGIMTDDVDSEHGEGFVCERRVNSLANNFLF